jgi:outer membrane biosynthesis protein TonB
MRPDDVLRGPGEGISDAALPIDADLQALDAELDEAGVQARRMLHGRSQPTRYFSVDLRARLASAYGAAEAAAPLALDILAPAGQSRGSRLRPELEGGESWAPTPLAPRIVRRTPTILPRARWALLAAAALTGVLIAGALGVNLSWILPVAPTESSSPAPSIAPVVVAPSPTTSAEPVLSPFATEGPAETPVATPTPTQTERPKPSPTPKPTPKPEPTKPPMLPMSLAAKACPGGVVLDWSKPATQVAKYRVLRAIDGSVPPTYPAPATTDVETARSWDASVTDGFDASVDGGQSATYRAYAFDSDGQIVAMSGARTITTSWALSLGALGYVDNGDGASITVSWSNPGVAEACFSYGKLVVSEEDPEPSYLNGSPHIAVISSSSATGAFVEIPAEWHGKTVWMRYQMIRATSLGKFAIGATDVIQVTLP